MRRSRRRVLAGIAGIAGVAGGCLGAGSGDRASVACPAPAGSGGARIGLVGDVMFGRGVDDRWNDPGHLPEGVWTDLRERLRRLDGLVCNLECCVSDRGTPRDRTFTFRADPDWAVPALRAAGVSAVSLANNHVLDYGPPAFRDTLAHLESGGIRHAGAGEDLAAALAPTTIVADDIDVAVVALTDQYPAYGATPAARGTAYAPLEVGDPRTTERVERALAAARETDPDVVVASLHWGPNWDVRPSEAQRAFARDLVDRGVDVVHGHSAHVVQGVEVYRGRPIVYDAGDFVDDYVVKEDLHNDRSFLFVLEVADGSLRALDLVPIEIDDAAVHPADPEAAGWLRERMRTLSAPFGTTVRDAGAGVRIQLDECADGGSSA